MTKTAHIFALALGLASLAAPAMAQTVCGPTPALPDTERRTEYAGIVAQTGPFNVNFQLYGDGTDYGNWISVWVNGVALTPVTDFIVTSPTGTLATICRPISDAQVTFTAAQTGTIEIEGSRRPRRTSQASENAGITARTFNQVVSDMTAQLRERWDRQSRLLRTAPGDSVTPMPSAAVRAGKFLYFDNTGLNPQFTTGGAGSGNVVGPPSSTVGHFATWNNATGTLLADSATVPASAFANPTASVGLTAVNGSAVTIMRSDGAPPLSQAIVPTWTGVHTFSASPNFVLTGTGNVNVSNLAQNTVQFQGAGNSLTTAIHLNPGTGTLPTSTISEFVAERTNTQAFGGNYGRWSFSNSGTSIANMSCLCGEFGGTTATGAMGPFIIQVGVENPASTFKSYEFVRFQTTDGGAEDANIGASLFGANQPTPGTQQNRIVLIKPNIGSPGTRDSDAVLWEGKANNGTERAPWWRQFVNVTSNAGASTFKIQSNLNGAGWTDRLAITDAGALSVASLALTTPLVTGSGGTGGGTPSGTLVDNISGFSSTGFINRTGAGTYSFTGSTGSGSVALGTSPTITTPNIVGTTTNDNAAAGSVGELISCTATSSPNGSPPTSTVTITIASPGVITWTAHGLTGNSPVQFTTTGALPTGITASTVYYVVGSSITANTFQIATTIPNAIAGTSVNTSGTQSGTQTATGQVPLTTNVPVNVCALSLTAGDWDVRGKVALTGGSTTTLSYFVGSISTTSATLDQGGNKAVAATYGGTTPFATLGTIAQPFGPERVSIASTTTIFLVVQSGFGVSTNNAGGFISARRVR